MKRGSKIVFSILLVVSILSYGLNLKSYASEITEQPNVVIIEGNLSDVSSYEDQLNELLSDESVNQVVVVDYNVTNESSFFGHFT